MIHHIGRGGPVSVTIDPNGWRLFVREALHDSGLDHDELHRALRAIALADGALAETAFGVLCNCPGSWEDDYTEEAELDVDDWLAVVEAGYSLHVEDGDEDDDE